MVRDVNNILLPIFSRLISKAKDKTGSRLTNTFKTLVITVRFFKWENIGYTLVFVVL